MEHYFLYLFGLGVIAFSQFCFFALYYSSLKRNRNDSVQRGHEGSRAAGKGDSDIIIVGAGVAGAALAHTLGKVIPFFLESFSLLFGYWF